MDKSNILITRSPKSEVLKKYISYYYFHNSTNRSNQVTRITYYPNTLNALTIYKNSRLKFLNNFSIAEQTTEDVYSMYYGGIQKLYRIAEMKGNFDKIGIVFQPLGINSFITSPLANIISKTPNLEFNHFVPGILSTLDKVYKTNDLDERVNQLDLFFLAQINDFKEDGLEKALLLIQNSLRKYKVTNLANDAAHTQKTLSRKFKLHLNCTIKDYIEIDQFRKSFNGYLNKDKSTKLGELAYEFDYYDQSGFIKQFTKITGVNPKKLFDSVHQFGDKELFWNTKT